VQITVSDTGCGIPASEIGAIFEDFKQVDGTSSREIGGTGIEKKKKRIKIYS
jgi:signal transduction histidine kinase